jgi:hypothetical protein
MDRNPAFQHDGCFGGPYGLFKPFEAAVEFKERENHGWALAASESRVFGLVLEEPALPVMVRKTIFLPTCFLY